MKCGSRRVERRQGRMACCAAIFIWGVLGLLIGTSANAQEAKSAPAKAAGSQVFTASELLGSEKWMPLREPRFSRGCPWKLDAGYLVNTAPAGASREDVKGMKDGLGLSIYGLKDPLPLKFEVSGTFQVDGDSAAGFVLNAGVEGGALTSHYVALIHHGGVNLWKYTFSDAGKDKGDYLKLGFCDRKLQPDTDYKRKIVTGFCSQNERGHGCTISLFLNDEHVLGVTDPAPFPPGVMGLWLGEGYARVKEVQTKY